MSSKLNREGMEAYREAGEVASQAREEAVEMVKPGRKLIDIAEAVEDAIREGGAEPAFPCNLCLNDKAAHYSPPDGDETALEEGDLVKIDVGAHIDGYIADTATSVLVEGEEEPDEPGGNDGLAERREMIKIIDKILEKAIGMVEPGVNVGEIGGVIEETADEHGYNPISNLTGHTLEPWSLHGGISIPNVEKETEEELEEGDVVALEPFITDGGGEVEESPEVYIFRYEGEGKVSGRMAQQTLRKIKNNYGRLPFAERWLTRDLSRIRLQVTLRELLASNVLRPYYVLEEVEGGLVAQAEHTMIVTEDGSEVTTR